MKQIRNEQLILNSERLKSQRMKTGRNKTECYVSKNDLVMVLPKGKGSVTQFEVVEDIVKTDCKVRMHGRKTVWMVAAGLCPVSTRSPNKSVRQNG